MKILIVNFSDIDGGAARASYRLHKSLLAENIDSQMLVQNKNNDEHTIIGPVSKIEKILNCIRPYADAIPLIFYKNRIKGPFSTAIFTFSNIATRINNLNPDIVHLQWICGGMMSIEDIAKIKAPIIWTLHDNWVFTGGCHVMWECQNYVNNCGFCPKLNSNKENDLSRKIWQRKYKAFSKIHNLTIVGVSKWLNNCAKNSGLLKDKSNIHLPNLIDTNKFGLLDKNYSRDLWGLPKNKKLILFGASSATSDRNKGFEELTKALNLLEEKDIEFIIFGCHQPEKTQNFGTKARYLGYIYDEVSLSALYNAVDVMLVPSLQEAFGQTALEAMSCGTPVVAFKHTGLLDIVDHKFNGYLATSLDTSDLAYGIKWVLNNMDYNKLCDNARSKVVREFDGSVVSKKYIKLYRNVLDEYNEK